MTLILYEKKKEFLELQSRWLMTDFDNQSSIARRACASLRELLLNSKGEFFDFLLEAETSAADIIIVHRF